MEQTIFEFGQSVFWYVFVAQKHQLFLNLIFCEINVIHIISCKNKEAEIRKASNYLDISKKRQLLNDNNHMCLCNVLFNR